ncbi:uncharacterized protein LOC131151960 isoform X2 [Malania oleifera]|nr:uncharacterized protein LOC131151960 isoform X2 [Malania oleifera]XP_057959472.1 uncharacterized protein LOC131151960 isoform X2 [Malania oleifera]XP_057959473.1 uncharacterized protein LOC131151960 isoform X2 [Malania oleifera]XP_057959474.1 uncharacterized protein LOC131151960 isoform X2 [Malania oleifera]
MGSQAPTNNDRSRTYWTPTMERYFIDLMLEHMHRGNRVGHTFNKQAWTDMLNVFNAKFGSQYDKDVLKSRYTNLWKQFNDIKNLLSQGGFSWDETQQMVIADDYIWDAYIKAHPDARSYKTKPVLNFDNLCMIYGYTTADGRYSRSSHDVDIEEDFQAVNTGAGTGSLASSSNERSRTDWTPTMDNYFIELMLDQLGRGNKIGNTFNKQAWTDMLSFFNAKFGPQHGKRVLRHRYKKLWKYYFDVTILLKQKGFSWDEAQQIVAADDDVWDAYIKAHPYARSYRMKTLPSYKDLGLIYGDVIGDGNHCHLHESEDMEDNDILGNKAGEGKEGQIPTGTDRSRTYWTPPMDRYLIDLLLEQVHRGNKLGQTFISQAWVDMVKRFNVKFKSRHDKDVLKNRYKHLRRQYNEIKILLEKSGFSWDDTREMVIAEDHVWDAYIKAHPDARSYRVKTVPSYHKLCIIYGQESFEGRYGRLARNAEPDSEISVSMNGEDNGCQPLSHAYPLSIDWTPSMERYFIDLMLEQMQEGNMIGQTFNEPGWVRMVASFSQKFGLQFDRCILEDKHLSLIKEYNDIGNILNLSGFIWDGTQQILKADDIVWEAFVKEYPDAIAYRGKILGSYHDLCLIFGNGTLDGLIGHKVLEMETDHKAADMEVDGISAALQSSDGDVEITNLRKKRQATPTTLANSRKVHKPSKVGMPKALTEMAGVVSSLANKKDDKNFNSIENAIDALQAIPDIDDELLLDACDLLEDDRKAKTFLALDATLRKKWLLRKLRPQ